MELHGKAVLITGGAVRVGKAIALALAAVGSDIALSYHTSADEAARTVAEIEAMGPRALACRADVSQVAECRALVDATVAKFGRLDVLVNSASVWRKTPLAELDEAAWDAVVDVSLKGAVFCAQAAAPHLAAYGHGAIVNILDLSAYAPFPGFLAHSVGKGGLLTLTHALAVELAPEIRVNAVAPGLVLPPPGLPEHQVAAMARRTLLGRWGVPADVAEAVRYLVQADYVTGAVIHVDGGEHLAWRKR